LLSGGGDIDPLLFGQEPHQKIGSVDRLRDEMELQLTRKALDQDLPIFATCRGIQVLSVAADGTVYQDIASEMAPPTLCHMQKGPGWYASHTIDILPGSRLHQIIGSTITRVNSFHHQAVRDVGKGFIATAHTRDGVIEAIESPTHRFVLGVECHPELMWERHPDALNLFTAFVKACQ
jgi:putative glutamine amidotransferase